MFRTLFKRKTPDTAALTAAVHAAARRPVFFTDLAVPDSLDGRFETLVLHAHLVIRRLQREGQAGQDAAQGLFDSLTGHFDEALRAVGVGDMSVGRRVKTMISAFYGRLAAYDAGLAATDDAELIEGLRRNLYGTVPDVSPQQLAAAAAYMRTADAALGQRALAEILAAQDLFPAPLAPAAPTEP